MFPPNHENKKSRAQFTTTDSEPEHHDPESGPPPDSEDEGTPVGSSTPIVARDNGLQSGSLTLDVGLNSSVPVEVRGASCLQSDFIAGLLHEARISAWRMEVGAINIVRSLGICK